VTNYGQGIVINLFFGTIVNAAQGIASQVSGQLGVFSTTLIKALNPIIAKSEGAGNRDLMIKATIMGSKVSFFLMMILHIPFLIEMPYILKLWLKNVPEYAVIFCRLLLIRNLIEQLFIPLVSSLSAQGNIKAFQIASSILLLFPLTLSYVLFSFNYPPYSLYIIFIIYSIMASCIILYYTNKNFQLSIRDFIMNVLLRCVISFLIVFSISLIPVFLIGNSLRSLVTVVFLSSTLFIFTVYFIGFTLEEREKIKQVFVVLTNKVGIKMFSNKIKPA
jgi:O-antigen/teichoic acid export membrane protein